MVALTPQAEVVAGYLTGLERHSESIQKTRTLAELKGCLVSLLEHMAGAELEVCSITLAGGATPSLAERREAAVALQARIDAIRLPEKSEERRAEIVAEVAKRKARA